MRAASGSMATYDTAAVLCGFYAIYHVIFLKFRMER